MVRSRPPFITNMFKSRSLLKDAEAAVRHNHVNQQHSAILCHRSTAISKDCNGTIIVPIMDHPTQKVSVCSLWNRGEEIPGNV